MINDFKAKKWKCYQIYDRCRNATPLSYSDGVKSLHDKHTILPGTRMTPLHLLRLDDAFGYDRLNRHAV